MVCFDTKGGPRGDRDKELRNSLHCKKGRVGKKEEKMWGKKDMTREGSQNRTNQCKTRDVVSLASSIFDPSGPFTCNIAAYIPRFYQESVMKVNL